MKPSILPQNPRFSSGPCTKRPGWSLAALDNALLGRSHRSTEGKARLKRAIDLTREVLRVPDDHLIGIVPASDTGAVELALWSLLGAKDEAGETRVIDVLAWESFSLGWVTDIRDQLKPGVVRVFTAEYGELPDLSQTSPENDIVFAWNGTTSGVRVPDGDWISGDRAGLTICDATSAAFAMDLPWGKLDAVTYSWQKVMGGEAAHGMLILSPRAVKRLESHIPPWPMPKIFRLMKGDKLNAAIFEGETINTPSMLALEDYLDTLGWAASIGGLDALMARADANLAAIEGFVEHTPWVDFLARDPATRSNTSVCLKVIDPWFTGLDTTRQRAVQKEITGLLEAEGAGFDFGTHRDAPPGFRLWAGATVETADLEALFPWLDWAYREVKSNMTIEATMGSS